MSLQKPVVALVGRPNVGKSTLFNRLIGERIAIVEDIPGTTRDRIYGDCEWNGVVFTVIDTGGLEAPTELGQARARRGGARALAEDSELFIEHIQNQARVAVEEADAVVFVVDGLEGHSSADSDIAEVLRATELPIFVAVNKTEGEQRKMDAVEFWNIGLGEPLPISAYHGEGVGDLLDEIVDAIPAFPVTGELDGKADDDDGVAIAIVGRPNVGKSSLLNTMIGKERAIVSAVPGTTRDPIDMEMVYDKRPITLIDTAGIRRRGKVVPGIEKYSVLRSMRSIDRCDVALLLVDATEGVTAQDTHVAGYVLEKMKGVVVAVNKWDALEKDTYTMINYTQKLREELKFMDYVPVLYISALTKQRVNSVLPTALEVADARRMRIPTSVLNQVIREAYDRISPPNRGGRPLRIYYATQVSVSPPTFVIFVNDPEMVHFSYERYLENRIREQIEFVGTPIRILFRKRTERAR